MSPVFSHGGLRLYLLSLLDEQPQHGYDLMRTLAERTGGTYTPSAGTIYPRLAKLEEEGLVTHEADGRKSVYSITDAGREELAARQDELQQVQAGLADSVRLIAREVRSGVTEAMRSLRADLAAAAQNPSTAPPDPDPWNDRQRSSRLALRQAELSLSEFRQRVRTDLRSHVAHGHTLDTATVKAFSEALGSTERSLRALLGLAD